MDTVTDVLTAAWALRYILILIAFALLGWLYAEALADLKTHRSEVTKLRRTVADRDETVRRLRLLAAAQRRRNRHQTPILAGRVIR